MKKLLTLVLLFSVTVLSAQVTITTEGSMYCDYNTETEEFENCEEYSEYVSRFVLNDEETIFIHTTSDMVSTYYIDEVDHKIDKNIYIYYVTSDVGNEYIFVIDIEQNVFKILSTENNYGLFHRLKRIF